MTLQIQKPAQRQSNGNSNVGTKVDIRGNPYGLLAAHPLAPLVSLHHLDYVQPVFPGMTQIESLKKLTTAYEMDPSRALQQSFCYNLKRPRNSKRRFQRSNRGNHGKTDPSRLTPDTSRKTRVRNPLLISWIMRRASMGIGSGPDTQGTLKISKISKSLIKE
ncbi:hypothetical protein V6N13_149682 [Hibiscus sabdariffa]|uniref:Uncharacterized protein n=2 Tax=Hibiscus sabdariffa TaxID=183260 RepID=A0ABR2EIB2_9ROSI